MENLSKPTIDESSASMYFSFNSTTVNKTLEAIESCSEISDEEVETEQNHTLGAGDKSNVQQGTVKKSFVGSPLKAVTINKLRTFKALSSTPTKAQLLRSVEVTRGSSTVDISDLGLAFLDAPQEYIKANLSDDKENQAKESQEICSETSSEIIVSVIERTQEVVKPMQKRVGFSALPVLKMSGNSNIRYTPKIRRSVPRCESDLLANCASRILPKKTSKTATGMYQQTAKYTMDDIPKMLTSILKLSKDLPMKRKSFGNSVKPFNLLGKSTRQTIVKTTLNSPARRASRKSFSAAVVKKNSPCLSALPTGMPKKEGASTAGKQHNGKSMLPCAVTSPQKRIAQMISRKSLAEKTIVKQLNLPSRKSMISGSIISTSSEPTNATRNAYNGKERYNIIKDEHVCEVCSRKFRLLSLYEAHKCVHKMSTASSRQPTLRHDNQCRYCDKKFAIAKALTNHLIQNCTKIPPEHKKKLLYSSNQPPTIVRVASKQPAKSLLNPSKSKLIASTLELDGENQSIRNGHVPPQSINKIKKQSAHTGVYCTPNKQIPCHICKICFSSILAYTEHSLSHTTTVKEVSDISTTNESTETQFEVRSDGTQTSQVNKSAVSN